MSITMACMGMKGDGKVEEDAGELVVSHNAANMVPEPGYDFTAMDHDMSEKNEDVDAAIAQIFDPNDDDKGTDEKVLGEEGTLKDLMAKLWNLEPLVKQLLPGGAKRRRKTTRQSDVSENLRNCRQRTRLRPYL